MAGLHAYAAVDLRAAGGRVLLGRLDEGRLSLQEVHRFAHRPARVDGTLRWKNSLINRSNRWVHECPGQCSIVLIKWRLISVHARQNNYKSNNLIVNQRLKR